MSGWVRAYDSVVALLLAMVVLVLSASLLGNLRDMAPLVWAALVSGAPLAGYASLGMVVVLVFALLLAALGFMGLHEAWRGRPGEDQR